MCRNPLLPPYLCATLALLLLLTACGQAPPASPPTPSPEAEQPSSSMSDTLDEPVASLSDVPEEDLDPRIAEAQVTFAIDLFHQIRQDGSDRNLLLSPVSIATALAMTANGAEGETRESMLRTLHLHELDDTDRNKGYQTLLDQLKSSNESTRLMIANALFADESVPFKPSFIGTNREYFGAEIAQLDLAAPDTADKINGWVSRQTEGQIEEIIQGPLDPLDVMVLLNAVYFKANWAYPFEENLTSKRPFTSASGKTAEADMMLTEDKFAYLQGEDFQAIRLPYQDHAYSMLVFLPDESVALDDWLAQLTPERWSEWLAGFQDAMGALRLPRFEIEDEIMLNDPLKALGMVDPFDPVKASFGELTELEADKIYLHEAKHKSTIEVSETGTVAAAVTSIVLRDQSGTSATFDMEVNRPFFFAIHDDSTSSILFMGAVRQLEG
ncbi:serpin family protein [Paenibacillus sp. 1P07SE]|uniref:serpin family protein n=1 Tax=Paenibacillus sp. 1P07SE TaxID=3132209 RepID=UPI0039A48454